MIPASTEWRCAHGKGTGDCQACLQREPWLFYDVVLYNGPLRCLGEQTDPFQLRDKNTYPVGWKIVCRKSIIQTEWPSNVDSTQHVGCALPKNEVGTVLNDMTGVLVNVMGSFNRGKTWLLDQLCKGQDQGVALPAGMCMLTPGISAKCAKVKDADLVLVDMQGGNTPISSCNQDEMNLALIEEQFLRQVVSKLCNNFLFVVGKMTMTDQRDLLALCKLCKSQDKKIFVVHNFMEVTREKDFTAHIQEVSALLGTIDNTGAASNNIERRVGTVFIHEVDGSEHKGMIEKVEGSFIHVEWEEQGKVDLAYCNNHEHQDQEAPGSFLVEEWQHLVQERKIYRPVVDAKQSQTNKDAVKDGVCSFAEEHSTQSSHDPRTIRTFRGTMDGVEQVHFFLARNPSDEQSQAEQNGTKSAGTIWNRITIEHLRNTIIAAGKRTTGKGKDTGRFNYMVQLNDAFAQVVPEGLMVTNFEQDGSDVQNSVHCNRYKRTQVAENGFVVEQRMLVLEVPGYEKVDLTPCPDNEDINIDDGVLEVILRRKSPLPSDEWIEDGHGNDIHVVENKIQKYDMEMGWKETEITQNNGFLTILIHGKRKRLNRR